jgi:hypothetical protein
MISVDRVSDASPFKCQIEIDDYVPLRFRSYVGTLGVKYLRIGNFETSLLEFLLEPESLVIRGFTLTSFDKSHEPMKIQSLPTDEGLPVILLKDEQEFQGPTGAPRIDLREEFSVGLGENFVEIDFGGIAAASNAVKIGNVVFFTKVGRLVGIRVTELKPEQLSILKRNIVA